MGDYSYLDDLPPSGGEDEFGRSEERRGRERVSHTV